MVRLEYIKAAHCCMAKQHNLYVVMSTGNFGIVRNQGITKEGNASMWWMWLWILCYQVKYDSSQYYILRGRKLVRRRWWLRNGGGRNRVASLKALSFGFMPSFCNVHFFPFIHLVCPAGEGLGNINL